MLLRQLCRRQFSRAVQENLMLDLRRTQPTFAVPANNVRVLTQPTEFYNLLLDMIRRAEKRIFISSLYIGSARTELIDALSYALNTRPSLQLHLVLDLNRSTRPEKASTAKILLPLLQSHPKRVHVSLFRSPSLRGVLAKLVPPRFNEGWGTWHAKVYGIDDEVMISGANLNNSYFTNRQDRYIHFNGHCAALAQYCFDFLKAVSTVSYRLKPSLDEASPHSYVSDGYAVQWPHTDTHPHRFHSKAQEAFKQLRQSYKSQGLRSPDKNQVLIYPIIQAGQFGVREEETALASFFRTVSSEALVDLTSGYFGLYKPYQDLILSARDITCRIVAASPKSNGFYGSSGISGRIPEGYTLLEQRFMKAVGRAGRRVGQGSSSGTGVELVEWGKPGWTYHAKGLWLSQNTTSPPVLTLFGSTNLNSRSAHLDTELSFMMLVPPRGGGEEQSVTDLRLRLAEEVRGIRKNVHPWLGKERKVRLGTKAIVSVVGGML